MRCPCKDANGTRMENAFSHSGPPTPAFLTHSFYICFAFTDTCSPTHLSICKQVYVGSVAGLRAGELPSPASSLWSSSPGAQVRRRQGGEASLCWWRALCTCRVLTAREGDAATLPVPLISPLAFLVSRSLYRW